MRRAFPYPRTSPAITFVTSCAMAAAAVLFMWLSMGTNLEWTFGISTLLFFTVVVIYASPLFTQHVVGRDGIELRYGWVFRADIPFGDIASIEKLEKAERARGALDLTTEKTRRLVIRLKRRTRFPHALFRSSDAIAISVNDLDGFIKAARGQGDELYT